MVNFHFNNKHLRRKMYINLLYAILHYLVPIHTQVRLTQAQRTSMQGQRHVWQWQEPGGRELCSEMKSRREDSQ